ncbi:MAG: fused MFS/spermidine synthase [Gammaproteobacteria bacterium]|nr:fused MFS/spermidine synthase [Gammaproteobacteria bacterium]
MSSRKSVSRAGAHYLGLCLCFTLSGVAALVYQTAWTRQFALVFGTSELAVATVLAAYMGGLALGARLIEPWLGRIARPVRWYALAELGIGLSAAALVPAGLWLAERLLVLWLGGQPTPPDSLHAANGLFYLVAAGLILLLPTTLMGATLPLLVRDGVQEEAQIGPRIGLLYACNTAGAVGGALLAALALLPALGLTATIWMGAGVNLLVGLAAWLLIRPAPSLAKVAPAEPAAPVAAVRVRLRLPAVPSAGWVLPIILLSGAVSFLHEVLWTRLLQRVVGGSVQAFGVMVASFLLGIAIGGFVGAALARTRERAVRALGLSQIAIAIGALIAWHTLQAAGPVLESGWSRTLLGLLALLPLTFAIGLTYPLAVRVLATDAGSASLAAARVYSWNTVGAIAGALLGGYVLVPALRYEGALHLAMAASAALALASATLLARPTRWFASVAGATLLAALVYAPAAPERLLRVSPLKAAAGKLVYYGVGRSADVIATLDDGFVSLRTNGLPEAGILQRGVSPRGSVEAWMPALAVLARPQAQRMLIVGLGGGNIVRAVPPSVRAIDVIELEPEVVAANHAILALRGEDPLADQRVTLIENDARGALLLTCARYDAIVSQPSHPWTAGASHLYTLEFMRQARAHLAPGGVFVQWMSAEFLDEGLLRSLLGTVATVFPQVRVYATSPTTLVLLASDAPIGPEVDPGTLRLTLDGAWRHYARIGLHAPEDLVAAMVLDTRGVRAIAAGAPLVTDDDNRLATANRFSRGDGLDAARVAALIAPYDPLTHAYSLVHRDLGGQLDFAYVWRRVVFWAGADRLPALERLHALAEVLGDTPRSVQLRHQMAMQLHEPAVAADLLQQALARWPDDPTLHYLAIEPQMARLASGQADAAARAHLPYVPEDVRVILDGMSAAAAGQWDRLRALDTRLAVVPWTAPWGLQAARLRCEWRVRVGNAELRPMVGEEGIAIADRALSTQPDLFWYSLRALSAVGTGRLEVELESINGFARTLRDVSANLGPAERQMARNAAAALQPLLGELAGESQLDSDRYHEVREHFVSALSGL